MIVTEYDMSDLRTSLGTDIDSLKAAIIPAVRSKTAVTQNRTRSQSRL